MALQVRRTSLVRVRVMTTLMMVFALVAQPLYGFVSAQIVNAVSVSSSFAITDHVVINEISTHSNNDQVELYNPTAASISLVNYSVQDSIGNTKSTLKFSSTTIASLGFVVVDMDGVLNKDGDKAILFDGSVAIDTVAYGTSFIAGGQGTALLPGSNAKTISRTYNASTVWAIQNDTIGATNGVAPTPPPAPLVDTVAPAVPNGLSWVDSSNNSAQNGFTNVQKGILSWGTTTPTDVDHYVYKFWTNISGYQDDASHPWSDSYSYVVKTSDGGHVPTDFADKQGTYYFCVEAVDKAGNNSGCSDTLAVTYDKTVPTATLSFPAPGPAAKSFTVQFSEAVNPDDAVNSANYFLDNWDGILYDGLGANVHVTYAPESKTATVYFDSLGWYVSGEQKWGVQNIQDLAGNILARTTAYSTTPAAPTAPIAPVATSPTSNKTINWSWGASTDPGDYSSGDAPNGRIVYHYTLTKGGDEVLSEQATAILSATTTIVDDGIYTLHVWAVDLAGNRGEESTGDITIDTAAPTLTIETLAPLSNDTTPAVSGTIESGAGLELKQNGVIVTPTVNGTSWSYSPTLADGEYEYSATATDVAGNVSTATTSTTIDTKAPTLTMGVPTANTSGLYSVSGTTNESTSPVFVSVNGGTGQKAVPANNGAWTATLGVLNAGQQYSIVANSSDGVNSSATVPYLLTVPTVVTSNEPAVAIIETPVLPVIVARTDSSNNFNTVGPATTLADPTAVLGTHTAKADSAVLGASENIAAIAPSEQGWKIFGMAWFWWALIVAAIASIIWWIVAAARRRSQNA